MDREFDSVEDAKAFVEKAKEECGGILAGCKDFKISKVSEVIE